MTVECPDCGKVFQVAPFVLEGRVVVLLPVHGGRAIRTCMAGGKQCEIDEDDISQPPR